jgi:CDP-diacylglycerol--serine O-phosphatidyltransferase
MAFVWSMNRDGVSGADVAFVTPFFAVIAGLLMVSRVRYFSFKAWPAGDRVPFIWIIAALLILVLLAIDTAHVLLAIAVIYTLSGVVLTLWGLAAHRRRLRRGNRLPPS